MNVNERFLDFRFYNILDMEINDFISFYYDFASIVATVLYRVTVAQTNSIFDLLK